MGNEIYTALRSYEGHVKVNIVMVEVASIIAMAVTQLLLAQLVKL